MFLQTDLGTIFAPSLTNVLLFVDTPSSLAEAEKLLSQHQTIKEEIDNYRDEYAKMMEYGEKITAVSYTLHPKDIKLFT